MSEHTTPDPLPEADVAIDCAEDAPVEELVGDPVDPAYVATDAGEAQPLDDAEEAEAITLDVHDATVEPAGEVQ